MTLLIYVSIVLLTEGEKNEETIYNYVSAVYPYDQHWHSDKCTGEHAGR